jgi:hypothetical protein
VIESHAFILLPPFKFVIPQSPELISRENGYAVPGTFALPDRFVPESPKSVHGKGVLLCLELLETHHVRFSFRSPSEEVVEPLIDVVNIEGGDSHQAPFYPCASGCFQRSTEFVVSEAKPLLHLD